MSQALIDAILHYSQQQTGESPYCTAIDGLILLRSDDERPPTPLLFKPALCLVAQGRKWALFGEKRLDYAAGQSMVVSVEMPALGRIAEASADEPYLGLVLELDPDMLREMVELLAFDLSADSTVGSGAFVMQTGQAIEDCALRLVRLLANSQAAAILAASIKREICYWLLTGPYGREIAKMVLSQSYSHRMLQAVHYLRDHFQQQIRIDTLAERAQMSASAFHRQFKALTAMTPLQYQKQLRLLEARRLMVAEGASVEGAAFQVGYESASQFSREYVRMFAAPPRRDVASLRTLAGGLNALST